MKIRRNMIVFGGMRGLLPVLSHLRFRDSVKRQDNLFAPTSGFKDVSNYVCAALLCRFREGRIRNYAGLECYSSCYKRCKQHIS